MLVRNNTTEPRAFAFQLKPADEAARRQPVLQTILLIPGNNEVDPAVWDALVKNECVRRLLEEETEFNRPILEPDKDVSLKDISKIPSKKAVQIVKGTFDRGLLRAWQRPETRRDVGDAIDKQLKAIDPRSPAEEKPAEGA